MRMRALTRRRRRQGLDRGISFVFSACASPSTYEIPVPFWNSTHPGGRNPRNPMNTISHNFSSRHTHACVRLRGQLPSLSLIGCHSDQRAERFSCAFCIPDGLAGRPGDSGAQPSGSPAAVLDFAQQSSLEKICSRSADRWNFGLCATIPREPRQARKGATVTGPLRVPRSTRSSSHCFQGTNHCECPSAERAFGRFDPMRAARNGNGDTGLD
jgi:hypothetical protein